MGMYCSIVELVDRYLGPSAGASAGGVRQDWVSLIFFALGARGLNQRGAQLRFLSQGGMTNFQTLVFTIRSISR